MKTPVSIVMCVRNVDKHINICIRSILDQTYDDFELVIVDDLSTDSTRRKIEEFHDERIRYFKNQKWLGISKSRNRGISESRGEYVFFTDGDCKVSKDWLDEGMRGFQDSQIVGVEGRTYYVSEDYVPTFSDYIAENKHGGLFLTCNIAYKKRVVDKIGRFDENMAYYSDKDLALRVMKHGRISFRPGMIVYIQQQTVTPKDLMNRARRARGVVQLFKKLKDKENVYWRLFNPLDFARLLCPSLVFLIALAYHNFKKPEDFRLLPYMYPYLAYERLNLWKESAKERVFLI